MNSNQDKSLLGLMKVNSLITFVISVVIFLALSWIYFYPNDVHGDVMEQHDMTQGIANGQEVKQYKAEHNNEAVYWTDALFGGMPTFQISPSYDSTSWLSWVGSIYSLQILGMPPYVSWIFMLMLGFFILMLSFDMKWYYAVLGAIGYAFSSYFFIILGAGHIWKLLTLCYIPPTIAGIVLCYRGKYLGGAALAALFAALQLQSNHIQMSYYSAFIILALVIAYLCKAIKDKKMGSWGIATGSLVVAAALAIASNAPNLFMTYQYSKETMRGGHSELTAEKKADDAQKDANAIDETPTNGGLSKGYITQWSYGIGETFTLVVPNVKGGATIKPTQSPDGTQIVNEIASLDKTSKYNQMDAKGELGPASMQYLSQFPQYFGDQPMTNGPVYVGALIFALFILGCFVVKGPVKWALLVVTLLSIMLAWGKNFMGLTDFFIDYFPLYNKFRTVSSILVIAEITMPILAVLALHKIFTEENFMKKHGLWLYISFGISAVVCLFFALFASSFDVFSQQENEAYIASGQLAQVPDLQSSIVTIRQWLISSDAWRSLFVIVVGFAIIFAYLKGWLKTKVMVPVLLVAAVVLIDMYTVNKRYIDRNSFISKDNVTETKIVKTPADATILKDTTQNYRVFDQKGFSDARSSYFHKTIGGYHAAKLSRYNDIIDRQISKGNMGVLNMLNAKWMIMDQNNAQQNPGALGNAWFVDQITYVKTPDEEMAFLDTFMPDTTGVAKNNPATAAVADEKFKADLGEASAKTPGDTIYETTYAPGKVTYHSHSAKGGIAVFSEIYFPWGWKVTVDGKDAKMGRVNYVLRAMNLPAGDHTIVMSFEPDEVSKTDTLAKTAILLIFVLVIASVAFTAWRGNRKEKEAVKAEPTKDDKK